MHPRARHGLLALALVAALTGGTAHAQPTAARGRSHSTPAAHRALMRAQGLLHRRDDVVARRSALAAPATAPEAAPAGHEATLVLRDLALRFDDLGPADRRAARQILARPTDPDDSFRYAQPQNVVADCTAHFCVHWVNSVDTQYGDNPPLTDSDGDGVPDQVELTEKVLEHVWTTEVDQMGYPAPPGDGGRGGNDPLVHPNIDPSTGTSSTAMTPQQADLLDVYLLDIGQYGYYGYCANDPGAPHTTKHWASYCAFDNDFSTKQFPGRPLISLEVTAAHEFFHTIQFGMDASDDRWFMESTAAWIEDEVYDGANDNRQYLQAGPLGHPGLSLDYFNPSPRDAQHGYQAQYGDWVFWKKLSERWGRDVVRQAWTTAARQGGYSLPALRDVLRAHGTTLPAFFARFSAENRYPAKVYDEGRAYPKAPLAHAPWWFGPRHMAQDGATTLNHLSSATFRFSPARALTGHRTLRVSVDMPNTSLGSAATAVVHLVDGSVSRHPLGLGSGGAGQIVLPFSHSRVAAVELTLSDASTRMHCGQGTLLACDGTALDDGRRSTFRVSVSR